MPSLHGVSTDSLKGSFKAKLKQEKGSDGKLVIKLLGGVRARNEVYLKARCVSLF